FFSVDKGRVRTMRMQAVCWVKRTFCRLPTAHRTGLMRVRTESRGSEHGYLKFATRDWGTKFGRRSPEIEKNGRQRPAILSITRGNVAQIFASGTWPTETGLAGWACKTRT